ncbi:FHA domain-containing protein [Phycicoccus sp. MAQZ13P-2]|uniref:FtsK/SpoIIIE domain-containing protein n=1 Tax=Phycicoccus mangrovi TaxID=2840470 RepID=UPI001C0046C9|nr:FtsK/SpoIIIE domain-containing protein [Phycicoccus mangrovi]MBT9258040.1 FHA domain-containing protein [Phycicoccus mangrovi]MBT9276024.1 FHA domain-containing protein [Phycicoccus mangrovi]
MKLKVTLRRGGGAATDLLVTADASTTVGELAGHLALSDPDRSSGPGLAEVTLAVVRDGERVLDPRTPLADSPLRSGATIRLAEVETQFAVSASASVGVCTVHEGPDAGVEIPLLSGTNMVGRQRGSEIRLSDVMVSRAHARVNVTDHVEVVDTGSANGVEVNGGLVSRAVVRPDDRVRVGDSVLSFRLTTQPTAAGRTESSAVGFIRSPRLAPRYAGKEFEPPEAPQRTQAHSFPMTMLVLPVLMAGILYLTTRQWTSILFAALSPLMMIGSWWEQRRQGRRVDRAALAAYREDLDLLVEEVREEAEVEAAARRAEYPSVAECLEAAHQRRPLMWTRRPGDWGFLELRLGRGTLASRSTVAPIEGRNAPRELLAEGRERLAHLGTVADVPVVATPATTGGIGIAGPRGASVAAARALVVQVAALHSPAEVAVTLLTSQRSAPDWEWLKWLPHVDAPWSPVEARHLASDPRAAVVLLTALEALVARRAEEESAEGPAVLVVIESSAPADFGRLVELSEHGWRHGVHVCWVAPDLEQLPAACRTFVDTSTVSESGVGFVHEAASVTPVATETVSGEDALAFARSLAPVVDLGARNEDASDIPRSIAFLSMEGYEALGDQPEAVLERWTQNHSVLTGPRACEPWFKEASLRAAVGHSGPSLLHLDLRSDGPHALVGGTTGAGKSELLQAWILSMAANHSPQRLTFLLVDYKGGSAFADCANLPHTVGMVTDLDSHGVQRALESLSAELRHREHVLERAKAKDLMTMEKKWMPSAPPSLVIVVDEFAALVQEVPEFVDGVVNVAQRGRSLGLHLVLATQRPAGVIKDNLRANTNLRLALRVADEADSTDVLGSAEAAFFDPDLPGRAVSKTGPGRLVPFQTAYAGGHTGAGPSTPDIRVEELVLGVGAPWELPEATAPAETDVKAPTDISRVVATIRAANDLAALAPPRRPWLKALDAVYDLVPLARHQRDPGDRFVLGMVDLPRDQVQRVVAFEPERSGNLAVLGASGAGKSTVLRTLAVAAGLGHHDGPTWVYGLDFGTQSLMMIEELPHVGAVVKGSDDERVRRLISWLGDLVEERAARYGAVDAASVIDYRTKSGNHDEARVLLLVDNLGGFLKAYEGHEVWIDRLTAIASAGHRSGVHVVFTSDRSGGTPVQLAATVQQRLVLRMTSLEEYDNLGVPRTVLTPSSPPGRAVWEGNEMQVAVLGTSPAFGEQAQRVRTMAEALRRAGVPEAPPVRRLPEDVALADLPASRGEEIVVGVSDYTLGPMSVLPEGTFVVAGPPVSGRTTALATIVAAARRRDASTESYLFTQDRRSPLLHDPGWTATALGTDQADALAGRLATVFARDLVRPVVVVVEKAADWDGSTVELVLEEVVRSAVRVGAFVVTDSEPSLVQRPYNLVGALNTSRRGFLLQPDAGSGDCFGVRLPIRTARRDFPLGRGYLAGGGRVHLGQLAVSRTPSSASSPVLSLDSVT